LNHKFNSFRENTHRNPSLEVVHEEGAPKQRRGQIREAHSRHNERIDALASTSNRAKEESRMFIRHARAWKWKDFFIWRYERYVVDLFPSQQDRNTSDAGDHLAAHGTRCCCPERACLSRACPPIEYCRATRIARCRCTFSPPRCSCP
jgi:hypothetical protein